MRKLAFALFALLSFGALPSTPASAGCIQPSPCAGYVHHYRHHSCCNNTGFVYWVQQVASPCCAQPYYHHRIHAPRHHWHHRPIYRPASPWLRPLHVHPHKKPFFRPHIKHVKPYRHARRHTMSHPHRKHVRPAVHKPASPAKKAAPAKKK